jgi:uncharacterized protein YyaL (SSP411 family)
MLASIFVALTAACDKPDGDDDTGVPKSAQASKSNNNRKQVSSDLPGVGKIPADVHKKIKKALEDKKAKSDPTFRTHHKTDDGLPKYTNRLILSQSPYLQQHAHNPTNWYSWGEEAFEAAKREDKPVLLSVGYSTCHWCHVMERKSFEDLEIAEYINENYIPIKVDREQRPNIDDRYMSAVRMMSGGGGWPMTVWLTPQKLPFMGGTYYPPGRFMRLLKKMKQQYEKSPAELRTRAQEVASDINRRMEYAGRSDRFPDAKTAMTNAFRGLQRGFDEQNGGWGEGNKFPMPTRMQFLLRYHKRTDNSEALDIVTKTLDGMANNGIYDQVGGGFHRYSTDPAWMVPHFEKMLYDNGQLALTYTEAWQITKDPEYRRIVKETLDYLIRDMTNPEGALYAATSADSRPEPGAEREEGAFFVWTESEIEEALPDKQAKLIKAYYDVTEGGNWEGTNILHTPKTREAVAKELGLSMDAFEKRLDRARTKLYHVREQRPHPHQDDNVISAWNGLALEAFAEAALVFNNPEWLEQAEKIAAYVKQNLQTDEGLLLRNRTDGQAGPIGFASDYSFMIAGLLNLYEASADTRWLKFAKKLQDEQLEHYWDDEHGGFFQTRTGQGAMFGRQKPDRDGSTPSANSYAALNLAKMYQFTLNKDYEKRAREVLSAFGKKLERRGASLSRMLVALDFLDSKPREIAMVKPEQGAANPILPEYRRRFLPNAVLVRTDQPSVPQLERTIPWMQKKQAKKGRTTAYVCRDFTCKFPTTEPETFVKQISEVTPLK